MSLQLKPPDLKPLAFAREFAGRSGAVVAGALAASWLVLMAFVAVPAWGRWADARLRLAESARQAEDRQRAEARTAALASEVEALAARLRHLEEGLPLPNETGRAAATLEQAAREAGATLTALTISAPGPVTAGTPGAATAAPSHYQKCTVTLEAAGSRAALVSYLVALEGVSGLAWHTVDLVSGRDGGWRLTARGDLYLRGTP